MVNTAVLPAPELPPLAVQYIVYCQSQKQLAARTLALYTEDLHKLAANALSMNLQLPDVQSSHIRRWVAQMHSAGRSGRGIALILSGWRGFYTWLGREGLVKANPVQDVRAPKQPKPLPKALSVDEAVQLAAYRAPSAAGSINPSHEAALDIRDAAITELLYGSGLRVGEIVGLDAVASSSARGWLDLQSGEAHVLGKGSKRRSVPLGSKSVGALQAWLALRPAFAATLSHAESTTQADTQQALFLGQNGTRLSAQSIWQRLKIRSQRAGLATPVHPHMLRHSFASHVLQSSGDLRAVQELLGHANITSTQVYTRLDFQHLAKAYDAAHPRARREK